MENKRVDFTTAKLAKEKGFDFYDTGGYYHINEGYSYGYAFCYSDVNEQTEGCLLCPDQSLLQKWLREKYNQHIYLFPLDNGKWGFENNSISINLDHIFINYMYEGKEYNSYEEALEVGLQEALNFINSDLFIDNEG